MDKKELRNEMLHMRKTLPIKYVVEAAKITGGYILSLPVFQQAETVMLYCDFQNETGTGPLLSFCLKKKKKVVLPLTDSHFAITSFYVESEEDLVLSELGIRQPDPARCSPCSPGDVDLILVPGVAFDVSGARLGFGKGCYDGFLPKLRPDVPIIGLAYDFQVLPHIPSEAHDIRMDAILTDKGLLPIRGARVQIQ